MKTNHMKARELLTVWGTRAKLEQAYALIEETTRREIQTRELGMSMEEKLSDPVLKEKRETLKQTLEQRAKVVHISRQVDAVIRRLPMHKQAFLRQCFGVDRKPVEVAAHINGISSRQGYYWLNDTLESIIREIIEPEETNQDT